MSYHDKNISSEITAIKVTRESILEFVSRAPSNTPSQTNVAECFNIKELTPQVSITEQSGEQILDHCWSICNIQDCNGNWITPNAPWIQGQLYGPFAFQNNPFNPPWTGTWTAQSPEFHAFYNWVVSQVGTLSVGDTIKFDMTTTNSGMCNILGTCAQIICFKYEGYLNWSNGFGWSIASSLLPTATLDSCCPGRREPIKTYRCDGQNCILMPPNIIGPYTSLSACQQYCGDGGWNCKTITNIGQPGSYQKCVQVFLPNIGTYTTLSDCQNGFINGGFGPCKKPPTTPTLGSKLAQGGNDKPRKLHKNYGTSGCYNVSREIISGNSGPESVGIPVFKICAYNLVTTYAVTTQQNPIQVVYDASNPWMISAWTDVANSTLYPSSFINYFNQIVAQTGPLVPGDKIEMNNNVPQPRGTTNSGGGGVCLSSISGGAVSGVANKFCLEYLGDYVPTNYPPNFPSVPIGNYSWNGNFLATAASIHIFSKFDCCKGEFISSTWDCLEKPKFTQDEWAAIGVGGSIPTAYSCQELFLPNVGPFNTKQDCLKVCSASYTTYD